MYEIIYNPTSGKPIGVKDGQKTIPIDSRNADFDAFEKWNVEQKTPLDCTKLIPVVIPETVETIEERLAKLELVQVNIAESLVEKEVIDDVKDLEKPIEVSPIGEITK